MPKRIVDGEGLWRSDKLAQVMPEKFRAEYANLLPLACANGSFECQSRRIWATVYGYNRPSITVETVEQILAEFERVGLLIRWENSEGKVWGYWTGIDKPGRLPPPTRLSGKHEKLGELPPQEKLKEYMASHRITNGQPKVALGFGIGTGFGTGTGKTFIPRTKRAREYSEDFETLWKAYPRKDDKYGAFVEFQKAGINGNLQAVIKSIEDHKRCDDWKQGYIPYLCRYIKRRRWEDENDQRI